MKCYNHYDRDAFGINIVTGKALCLECMEEYKGIIVEKNSEFSKNAVEKILTGYKTIEDSKSIMKIGYIIFLIIGISFVSLSFLRNLHH